MFPDYPAPVLRDDHGQCEMVMMRWGMPPPPPKFGGPPVTNIRNTSSPHWRGWLKTDNRCLVPATGPSSGTNSTPVPRPHSTPSPHERGGRADLPKLLTTDAERDLWMCAVGRGGGAAAAPAG